MNIRRAFLLGADVLGSASPLSLGTNGATPPKPPDIFDEKNGRPSLAASHGGLGEGIDKARASGLRGRGHRL